MKPNLILAIAVSASLLGCATRGANYMPLVDLDGKDINKYTKDVADCQVYARQKADAASGAAAGALIFAVLGAVVAAKGYRNEVAGRTALLGAAYGAGEAVQSQEEVTKRCMSGRGWNVLG